MRICAKKWESCGFTATGQAEVPGAQGFNGRILHVHDPQTHVSAS